MLRLLRQHADDIGLVMRLNAQYGSMVRTSLSVPARLCGCRRCARSGAIDGSANADPQALPVAERPMLGVVDPDAGPQQAAWPEPAPAADEDQTIKNSVSENETNSQDAAFETWLSAQFQGRGAGRPDGSRLHEVVRKAMAEQRSAGREWLANCRHSMNV